MTNVHSFIYLLIVVHPCIKITMAKTISQQYEAIIYKTKLKLLKLSSKNRPNPDLVHQYRTLIENLERKIRACEKYGYPIEFCDNCEDAFCIKSH